MLGRKREQILTLFFATDVHGSDTCFRKFIAAKTAYKADYLILGGDVTGKMIVSLVPNAVGMYDVDFAGQQLQVSADDRPDVEQQIRNAGFYPVVLDRDELAAYHNAQVRDELFVRCIAESLERWSEFAMSKGIAERSILVAPGNDDPWEIDAVIDRLPAFRRVEGEAVQLIKDHIEYELVSCGFQPDTLEYSAGNGGGRA